MDIRTTIINDVIHSLSDKLSTDQLNEVKSVLYRKLDEYIISKQETEIIEYDNKHQLTEFLLAKSTEGLSLRTIKQYRYQLNKMIDDINKQLDTITSYDLRVYLMNYKTTRCVSNRTLENMRLCYNNFFTWMFKEKMIPNNPCETIAPIKYEKTIKYPFSKSDIEKLKRSCTSKRDRALIEFLCATGCRASEISMLNRDSVNFATNTILVFGKGNKERIVYISQIAMMYLVEYLNSRTDAYPALFVGRNSERLTSSGIEHALKRIGKRAGVSDVYPHRFRRTFATNLLDCGADIRNVAELLGHNDIKTTQIYGYVSQSNVKATYEKYMA